jgi:hypothetical protein
MFVVEISELLVNLRIVGKREEMDRDRERLRAVVPSKHRQWDGRQYIVY